MALLALEQIGTQQHHEQIVTAKSCGIYVAEDEAVEQEERRCDCCKDESGIQSSGDEVCQLCEDTFGIDHGDGCCASDGDEVKNAHDGDSRCAADNKLLSINKASSATIHEKSPDDMCTTVNESDASALMISFPKPSHDEINPDYSSMANNDERGILSGDVSIVSTEFSRRLDKLGNRNVDKKDLYPAQSSISDSSDDETEANNHELNRQQRVLSIELTDHLQERLYERGFSHADFYKTVYHGSTCKDYGQWRFTYRGITAITDENVQVGITIYHETCPRCKVRGNKICDRGFCTDCCYGCDTCAGERCRQCKVRGETICGRGYCKDCCYGCYICR